MSETKQANKNAKIDSSLPPIISLKPNWEKFESDIQAFMSTNNYIGKMPVGHEY